MNINEIISSLKINILQAERSKRDRTNWRHLGLTSPFSRLYLITDGEAYVMHGGERYYMNRGTLHLVPCFTKADYLCYTQFEHIYIHFTSRITGDLDLFNIGNFKYQLLSKQNHMELFEKILQLTGNKENRTSEELEKDALLRLLLCPFIDTFRDDSKLPSTYFIKVLDYIDKNLDKPITLESIAKTAGLHPNYFSDQFKSKFGIRPIDYLNRKRIEKAQIMILTENIPIKEIADRTGFKDIAYFSRVFKKYSSVPPTKYRELIKV